MGFGGVMPLLASSCRTTELLFGPRRLYGIAAALICAAVARNLLSYSSHGLSSSTTVWLAAFSFQSTEPC